MSRRLMVNNNKIGGLINPVREFLTLENCIDKDKFIFEIKDTGWTQGNFQKGTFNADKYYRLHFKLIKSSIIGNPLINTATMWAVGSNIKLLNSSVNFVDVIKNNIMNGVLDEIVSVAFKIVSTQGCIDGKSLYIVQFQNSLTNSSIKWQMYFEEVK